MGAAASPKSTLFIPLGVGLATGMDDKLLPIGRALELQNAYLDKTGSAIKRPGNTALPLTAADGGANLGPAWQLGKLRDNLVQIGLPGAGAGGSSPIDGWNPARNAWSTNAAILTGQNGPVWPQRVRKFGNAICPDVWYDAAGYYLATFTDSTFSNQYLVAVDKTTGSVALNFKVALGGTTGGIGRVISVNGWAVFVYRIGANIKFDAWRLSDLGVTRSTSTTAGGGTGQMLDLRVKDTTTIQACFQNAGNSAAADYVPSTNTLTAWTPRNAAHAAFGMDMSQGWMRDPSASGKIALITANTVSGVLVQWDIPTAGATRDAVTTLTIDAGATSNVQGVTGHTTANAATGTFTVLYDNSATLIVKIGQVAGGGAAATAVMARSVVLTSKTWNYGSNGAGASYYYVLVEHPSQTQFTRYILKVPKGTAIASIAPLAMIDVQQGTDTVTTPHLLSSVPTGPDTAFTTGNSFAVGLSIATRTEGAVGNFLKTDATSVDILRIIHGAQPADNAQALGPPMEAVDSLFVCSGALLQFDGAKFGELGWAYAISPDQQAAPVHQAGGAMTGGVTYYYRFVYRRQDTNALVNHGAPSPTFAVAMAAGDHGLQWALPTLRITSYTDVVIEAYRGLAGDDKFFQLAFTVANDPTVDSVAFTDILADAALALSEPLYTNGGITQNDVIPGAIASIATKTRLAFISADDPREVWISDVFVPGLAPKFSDRNIMRIDDEYGDLRGIGSVDDAFVALKKAAVYAWSGEGPDEFGRNPFSEPRLFHRGLGTDNPRSVISTGIGLFFESTAALAKIQMLDRSLAIALDADGNYIGAPVQKYAPVDGQTVIAAAILVPEQQQVRFYSGASGGQALVYDLTHRVWSRWLGGPWGDAAVAWNKTVVTASGTTYLQESANVFADNSVGYKMRVGSPWVQVSGVRGFERIHELMGLGETRGDHTLTVSIYRDFDETATVPSGTKAFTMTTAARALWKWGWKPREQRYGAIKVVVEDGPTPPPDNVYTAGPRINGVTLFPTAKRGPTRMAESTRL